MEIQKSKGTNTKKIIVEKEKEKKGKKKHLVPVANMRAVDW